LLLLQPKNGGEARASSPCLDAGNRGGISTTAIAIVGVDALVDRFAGAGDEGNGPSTLVEADVVKGIDDAVTWG
jgi:hypothetical protein